MGGSSSRIGSPASGSPPVVDRAQLRKLDQ
jgi:hypothetical protein